MWSLFYKPQKREEIYMKNTALKLLTVAAITAFASSNAMAKETYDQAKLDSFVDMAVSCASEKAMANLKTEEEKAKAKLKIQGMRNEAADRMKKQLIKDNISSADFNSCVDAILKGGCSVFEQDKPPKGCEKFQ